VNGPEVLHLIRRDLQGAVARQSQPHAPRPMHISPWLAMSVLQKATRRGREDLALSAAATLLPDSPDKFWRRIGCIAYEDVGVASLEAVALATVALAGKRHRTALDGECAIASCIVSKLSGTEVPGGRRSSDGLRASPRTCRGPRRAAVPGHPRLDHDSDQQGSVQERALALNNRVFNDPSGYGREPARAPTDPSPCRYLHGPSGLRGRGSRRSRRYPRDPPSLSRRPRPLRGLGRDPSGAFTSPRASICNLILSLSRAI